MSERNSGKIGFVGYGAMGALMGCNLRQAGFEVSAYTPSGRQQDEATPVAKTARALAEASDILVLCVPNDAAVFASAEGEDGFLAGARPGTLVINCSTVSPEATAKLSELAQDKSLHFVDAPMSGSTPEAEKGELVMLVGATSQDLDRARPVLDAIGKLTIHAGEVGAGTRLKLVINGIMGATLNVIAEAVGYGLSSGLNRDMLYEALSQVAVISPHHKRKLGAAQKGDFSPQFPTRLMSKDMGLLIDAARRTHSFCPAIAIADQALALSAKRHANDDYAALLGAIEKSVVQSHDDTGTP
ncbi:NAD(P)-dependent oxidoreductase [Asaia lannensis]|uniref:NAD(P)-dependent oxidoreductase n=1 Tax=Asaia lannensis NBRC 102526 TaxID=1307926 RepID=A0ABT1CE94_9PROT|nr:NAD(P)-dependent oxidoreductase [Asaia lannensis]MCO6159173.1 NAD(P)-dependent oxidoreductase [Asaia lannensis NBRC 102526]GBQ97066.1 3-hydroxyisobutyrate dehydrogenase [Asaia lannensis NBRC 102526]